MVKYRVCLQTNEVLHDDLDQTEASEALCQLNTGEQSSDKIEKKYYLEEYDTEPEIKMSDRLGKYPTMADIYER